MGKKILLVDGSGLIFRAYYSLIRNPLRTAQGKNTSAIYGFFRMFFKLIKDFRPDAVSVMFDVSRRSFRTDIFPEYKANRDETPEELKEQIPDIFEMTKMMGVPIYAQEGYEADDLIGTLAEQLKTEHEVVILTGDKDLFQLVDDKVKVLGVLKGVSETRLLDREGVKEVKGVYPEQIPDYLGLAGDSSDNIPGVKGIGPKGAETLLAQYGTLEEIYDHIEEIKGATQTKLMENKENAFLSKRLAIVRRNLDMDSAPALRDFDVSGLFGEEFGQRVRALEMESLFKDIQGLNTGTPVFKKTPAGEPGLFGENETVSDDGLTRLDGNYSLVTALTELRSLAGLIEKQGEVSIDLETTSEIPVQAEIIGIAVSLKEKQGYYIPLKHKDAPTDFTPEQALDVFRGLVESPEVRKIGQNLKYEIEVFRNYGITLRGVDFDSMIAAYLIDSSRTHYNLDRLAEDYLRYRTVHYKELVIDDKLRTLLDVDIERVRDYAGEDADIALRLRNRLAPLLAQRELEGVYHDIELPLLPVLADMEYNGIKLDTVYLKGMSKTIGERVEGLVTRIYQAAGVEFNINSTKQLRELLFEKLQLPVVKMTPTKQASTDEEVLQSLAKIHPLPELLLEYRTLTKLKSTYIDALPALVQKKTGRLHTSFNQTVTTTGRLSSSDPNLQNIPIRDELGREIRKAFVAEQGYLLVSADYSQIELRLFAHLSGDPNMIRAFREGVDIHANTSAIILGLPVEQVTADQRRMAKTINYGISYGMGPFRLSHELGISLSEAKKFIEDYFANFPRMKDFMRDTIRYACRNGEVRTLFGRRRPVPELLGKKPGNLTNLNRAERFSINTVVQGTAADIMKIAMIQTHREMRAQFPAVRMLLQIHDELVFEVPERDVEKFKGFLKTRMEGAAKLEVPLTVDVGSGVNWAEAH